MSDKYNHALSPYSKSHRVAFCGAQGYNVKTVDVLSDPDCPECLEVAEAYYERRLAAIRDRYGRGTHCLGGDIPSCGYKFDVLTARQRYGQQLIEENRHDTPICVAIAKEHDLALEICSDGGIMIVMKSMKKEVLIDDLKKTDYLNSIHAVVISE